MKVLLNISIHFFPITMKHKCMSSYVFSAVHYSPFTAVDAAMSLKWSVLACVLVRVGSLQGAGLCCHEW